MRIEETVSQSAQSARLLRGETPPPPADLVAATRADYLNILQALYGIGHYGPEISIRIDGREASTLGPLDAPGRIDSIVITVDPGPRFTFGRTEISPRPRYGCPETFATGQVAAADVIGDAVTAGIDAWREAATPRPNG